MKPPQPTRWLVVSQHPLQQSALSCYINCFEYVIGYCDSVLPPSSEIWWRPPAPSKGPVRHSAGRRYRKSQCAMCFSLTQVETWSQQDRVLSF
ncbi:hypothetical protein BO78DRAFT_43586 [Aspergillus sclerotiicarbonarius CBS 121057]|uniref:Uncharacterized protein n=1 Tax=Aspergillus sclerotiicarbonarius (strain CBS 121057 / IBT 28362) TaxID=1448318 RepID=A0A319FLD1_ASPSB|nr:hypothetical protein BO78DRAFT_43586 [Aspergillus sclerotiicarbonarius CBS 121057]